MKIFWATFWSFLLSVMLIYVTSSMTGDHFNFTKVLLLTAAMAIIATVISEGILTNEEE
ncbi:DUF2929 family protein [Bacillaceae bacterium S4-13-58]